MSSEVFNSLAQSLREAGQIFRGETKDYRVFAGNMKPRNNPTTALAVCLETDDENLLIVGKIYNVSLVNDRISVKDEDGETVICPVEDFLVVEFQPQVEEMLRELVSA